MKTTKLITRLLLLFCLLMVAENSMAKKKTEKEKTDRELWCDILYKMAVPVLSNMSEGKLQEVMPVEVSPIWDGRPQKVTYMECFGRLMSGLAPWLSLPDDDTEEGKMRKQLREWALKSYAHAVDPKSKDPGFSFDYYNSFSIHPMYVECIEIITHKGTKKLWNMDNANYPRALKRMQRYGMILERLISPEGTFPVFGRSMTYRTGVFQPLALLAWREQLPEELPNGQVRAAMTAVIKRMFSDERNYGKEGFLTLGFNGSQPQMADRYTNNGSLYMASLAFLPLGLPANHPFWTDAPLSWTSKKAWEGEEFPRDHAYY